MSDHALTNGAGMALPRTAERRAAAHLAPARLWMALEAALRRRASRRVLASLDAHMLKDIGISPADAAREANKPFWLA